MRRLLTALSTQVGICLVDLLRFNSIIYKKSVKYGNTTKNMTEHIRKLIYILPAPKSTLSLMVILFLFSSMLEVFGIGIVGPFIALASNPVLIYEDPRLNRSYELVSFLTENQFVALVGLVVVLVFCTKTVAAWLTQYKIVTFSDRQQKLLIIEMASKYMAAPYVYLTKKNTSSIIDSVIEVANSFTNAILMPFLTTASNIFVSIGLFILLYSTSSTVVLVLLAVLLPVFIFINSFRAKISEWGKEVRQGKEGIIRAINHAFGSFKETKVIGCESYFNAEIKAQAAQLEKAHANFVTFSILPRYVMEMAVILCTVLVVCLSLLGNEDIGNLSSVLSVFALASIRLIPSITNAVNGINKLRNSSYTIDQIYLELNELKNLAEDDSKTIVGISVVSPRTNIARPHEGSFQLTQEKPYIINGNNRNSNEGLLLKSVSYKYSAELDYAVQDISLKIDKGTSVAFIGKSGAGKTTLVDIILGLLPPQEGEICYEGHSVYRSLPDWRKLIGYIPQSIFLSDDTIARNIAFGIPNELIDYQKLYEAIEAAQLAEVVNHLPNGIDTRVGERGILLSGGQRQRVGIARSLYHDREVLVLDEATAALDNETERLVTESIQSLSGQKTVITIAHRLSTIEHCDCIYVLERGKVINSGKYKDVIFENIHS